MNQLGKRVRVFEADSRDQSKMIYLSNNMRVMYVTDRYVDIIANFSDIQLRFQDFTFSIREGYLIMMNPLFRHFDTNQESNE